MVKSVKCFFVVFFIAGGGQCLLKSRFHVKLEVKYSYRSLLPVKEDKISHWCKNSSFSFLRFKALQCTIQR